MRVLFALFLILPQVLSIVWADWEANSADFALQFCQPRCNRLGKDRVAACLENCQKTLAHHGQKKKIRN